MENIKGINFGSSDLVLKCPIKEQQKFCHEGAAWLRLGAGVLRSSVSSQQPYAWCCSSVQSQLFRFIVLSVKSRPLTRFQFRFRLHVLLTYFPKTLKNYFYSKPNFLSNDSSSPYNNQKQKIIIL